MLYLRDVKKVFLSVFYLVSIFCFQIPLALAEFSATPDTTSVYPDSGVIDIFAGDSNVYMTGQFRTVGSLAYPLLTTNDALLSTSSGAASTTFPNTTQAVWASVSDGAGGFYVGGAFTTIGGVSQARLAHILASGVVDTSFAPVIGNTVLALALSSDGSVLYVGGQFTTVNGNTHNRLVALNTSDGSLVPGFVDPNPDKTTVRSLALSADDSTLYVGGNYATIVGQARNGLAAISTADGSLISGFNPTITQVPFGGGTLGAILSLRLSPDEATLYFGGELTAVGGQARPGLAAVQTSDGSLVASFNPTLTTLSGSPTISSLSLTADGTRLYIGGAFVTVSGQSVKGLAAVSTSNGALISSFAPSLSDNLATAPQALALALSSDETTLYVGGYFYIIGGHVHHYLGAVNTTNGSAITSFNVSASGSQVKTLTLSDDGTKLFAGGSLTTIGGESVSDPFFFSQSSNTVNTSFAPEMTWDINTAIAVSEDESVVYVGGNFTKVNSTLKSFLTAFDATNGSILSGFNATVNSTVYEAVLSPDGTRLYISGWFDTVGGETHNHVAAVDAVTGAVISAFAPNVDDFTPAMALSSDGSILYIGGDFLHVNGVVRNRVAAVNTSDGSLVTSFDPNVTATFSAVRGMALSPDDSTLYLGGNFTQVGGVNRSRIAAVNTADGSLVSAFNPGASAVVRRLVMYPDGTRVYAAGQFTTIGGQSIKGLASINTSDGSVNTAFSQTVIDAGTGLAISPDGSKLYAGNNANNTSQTSFLAIFTGPAYVPPTTSPTLTSSAASSITDTTATLNGTITATGGNAPTTRGFVYGLTTAYGATTTEIGIFGTGAYTGSVSSLTCNTTYHFRSYATNSAGSGYSADNTLTTSACPAAGGGSSGGSVAPLSGQSGHRQPVLLAPVLPVVLPTTTNPLVQNTLPPTSTAPTRSNAPLAITNAPGQIKKAANVDEAGSLPESDPIITTPESFELPHPTPKESETSTSSSVWFGLGGHIRTIGGTLSSVAHVLLDISDKVMRMLPGVARIIPLLLPLIPPIITLSTRLANAFSSLPLGEQASAYIAHITDFVLGLFGLKRKRNHLGVLFDSQTGEPLKLGYVTLHDARTGERVSVSVSDTGGAYGFFAKPGVYVMRVIKSGYAFPASGHGLELSFAGLYDHLYQGEMIEVHNSAEVVTRNIAMDRTSSYKAPATAYIHKWVQQFFVAFVATLFVMGFVSTIHNVFIERTMSSIIFLTLYLVVILIQFRHIREWGRVYSKQSSKLLSGLLVELNTVGSNSKVIDRAVSDIEGRFLLHSSWGTYILKIYEFGRPEPVAVKKVLVKKDGVVNGDYAL